MMRQAGEVWIVLDALDECPSKSSGRDTLLEWIYSISTGSRNTHLLITSRPEHDIHSAISKWAPTSNIIELQSRLVEKDISSYIQWEVRNRKGLQRWEGNQKVQQEIEGALAKQADGM